MKVLRFIVTAIVFLLVSGMIVPFIWILVTEKGDIAMKISMVSVGILLWFLGAIVAPAGIFCSMSDDSPRQPPSNGGGSGDDGATAVLMAAAAATMAASAACSPPIITCDTGIGGL